MMFKKLMSMIVLSVMTFISSLVFAAPMVDADCSQVKDGVILCTNSGSLYMTECYNNQVLQNIGNSSTWEKLSDTEIKEIEDLKKTPHKLLEKYGKVLTQDCSSELTGATTASYTYPVYIFIGIGVLLVLLILFLMKKKKIK